MTLGKRRDLESRHPPSILSSYIQTLFNPKHRHIVWLLGASLRKKFIRNFNKLMWKKKKERLDSVRTPERGKKIKFESWRERSLAVWEFTRERIGENDFNTNVEGKRFKNKKIQKKEKISTEKIKRTKYHPPTTTIFFKK